MAQNSYNCTVQAAGPASNGNETAKPVIYIRLTDVGGAFKGYWFFAAENSRNEMLTVALNAISTGKRVDVSADAPVPNNQTYTQIYRFYIVA
jgi:hypothetical protein